MHNGLDPGLFSVKFNLIVPLKGTKDSIIVVVFIFFKLFESW